MQTKCTSCGADLNNKGLDTCLYCGSILQNSINSNVDEVNLLELAIFEYERANFNKSAVHSDQIISANPRNFKAWCYKILSEFRVQFTENNNHFFNDDSRLKEFQFLLKMAVNEIQKHFLSDLIIQMLRDYILTIYKRKYWYETFFEHYFVYYSWNTRKFVELFVYISKDLPDEFSSKFIQTLIEFYSITLPKLVQSDSLEIFGKAGLGVEKIVMISPVFIKDIELTKLLIQAILNVSFESWKMQYSMKKEIRFEKSNGCAELINQLKINYSKLDFSELLESYRSGHEMIFDYFEKKKKVEERVAQKFQKTNITGGCFIATATTGDYNHPVVKDLRLFRDNWLLRRNWGVRLTNWYYTHGPKAARVIEKSYLLRRLSYIFIVKPLQIITKKLR